MDIVKFDQMKQNWYQIANNQDASIPASFELHVYKKLLELFHVGEYYYYVFNTAAAEIEFVSEQFLKVIGLPPESFRIDWIFENIHQEDRPRFLAYEKVVTDFFSKLPTEKVPKYKVSYDYRMRCKNGNYKWLNQQVTTIQSDEDGSVIRVLGVHTDISHMKTDNTPSGLSFIGLEGEPSFHNVKVTGFEYIASEEVFTKREKEVLHLVLGGKSSTEIANELCISKYTVDTHRKNIFSKSGCKTLAELGSKAIGEGWL